MIERAEGLLSGSNDIGDRMKVNEKGNMLQGCEHESEIIWMGFQLN